MASATTITVARFSDDVITKWQESAAVAQRSVARLEAELATIKDEGPEKSAVEGKLTEAKSVAGYYQQLVAWAQGKSNSRPLVLLPEDEELVKVSKPPVKPLSSSAKMREETGKKAYLATQALGLVSGGVAGSVSFASCVATGAYFALPAMCVFPAGLIFGIVALSATKYVVAQAVGSVIIASKIVRTLNPDASLAEAAKKTAAQVYTSFKRDFSLWEFIKNWFVDNWCELAGGIVAFLVGVGLYVFCRWFAARKHLVTLQEGEKHYKPSRIVQWAESLCMLIAASTGCVGLVREVSTFWRSFTGVESSVAFVRGEIVGLAADKQQRRTVEEAQNGGQKCSPPSNDIKRQLADFLWFLISRWYLLLTFLGAFAAGCAAARVSEYCMKLTREATLKEGALRAAAAEGKIKHNSSYDEEEFWRERQKALEDEAAEEDWFAFQRQQFGNRKKFRQEEAAEFLASHDRWGDREGAALAFAPCQAKGAVRKEHRSHWNRTAMTCGLCKGKSSKEGAVPGSYMFNLPTVAEVKGVMNGCGFAVSDMDKGVGADKFVTAAHLVSQRSGDSLLAHDAKIVYNGEEATIPAAKWHIHSKLDIAWCDKPALKGLRSYQVEKATDVERLIKNAASVVRFEGKTVAPGNLVQKGDPGAFAYNATSQAGSSGAPVMSGTGRVVGIHIGTYAQHEGLNECHYPDCLSGN